MPEQDTDTGGSATTAGIHRHDPGYITAGNIAINPIDQPCRITLACRSTATTDSLILLPRHVPACLTEQAPPKDSGSFTLVQRGMHRKTPVIVKHM